MTAGRLARTLANLHPLQVTMRVPHTMIGGAIPDVSGALAPRTVALWPEAIPALRSLANSERRRGAGRLASLPASSQLREYEACYGLELGADDDAPSADWRSRVAVEPFPASIRARRIAVAVRCGRHGLGPELARAARAVLLQPELHLLGNHLLENGFALVCAGAAAHGVEADLWWTVGARILGWQLPRQFLADGGHVERSASYHVALLAGLLEAIELAEASGRRPPAVWRATATRALGWLAAVRTPDGEYPLFNDSAVDAAPSPEVVTRLADALSISPAEVGRRARLGEICSMYLPETGWIRLDAGDACLVADAGPDAGDWQPGHAHADGLTFELWSQGRRGIVDFGVASYAPGPDRIATRATRSHNTVELDGRDSCEVWGTFRVGRRGKGHVMASSLSKDGALLRLRHDGYAWMPGAPRHERTLRLAPRILEVYDTVTSGIGEAVSRLRVDGAAKLRVSGGTGARHSEGAWYRRHGEALLASLYGQGFRPGEQSGATWRVEW